jgi:glycerol-3-phosphate dehydrogenase
MAPHIIHPQRFVLPHLKGLRPAWLIRLGLFLYDHLGGRDRLPASHSVDLSTDPVGAPLRPGLTKGFEYSDCCVDDARLVVLNARDAADRGADIHTRSEVLSAARHGDEWRLQVKDLASAETSTVHARALVNASGPWIAEVIAERIAAPSQAGIRLVKGSHIVVPRMFDHDRAYIFQNPDQRIIFAIPYEHDYTLIGTTDVDYTARPEDAAAEPDEIAYLCAAVGEYFAAPVSPKDVVWSFSGVRPLYDDGTASAQEATRDYVLELDGSPGGAVILNVFGGKITTYRHLAEEVLGKLAPWLPSMTPAWTRGAALPGGDFPVDGMAALLKGLTAKYPNLPVPLLRRLAQTYGTVTAKVLGEAETESDLGRHFGGGLHQREVEYLIEAEWARSAEDILWRRTKLGLRLSDQEVAGLASWLKEAPSS